MATTNGTQTNGSHSGPVDLDVLVVGGGFGGMYALHNFRKLGYKTKIFEAGSSYGGVWYWNRYPGARVDSEYPFYQINIPEAYETFDFVSRFPPQKEIKAYADHLGKVLDLAKDTYFNARVIDARWNADLARWEVKTEAGQTATTKYIFLASGLLYKRYTPDFPGIEKFKGPIHHSAYYPEGTSMKGKRVAVIGAGATAVQIVSTLAKEADHLVNFIRRPSYCFPMLNRQISREEQQSWRNFYPKIFAAGRDSRAGFPIQSNEKSIHDVSVEEREALFEKLWARGGFSFSLGNYSDLITDLKASQIAYDFWRRKVQERFKDKVKAELMAPAEMPYPFGTKRAPLEGDYYEALDQENVEIVSLLQTPLETFTETGIRTADGRHHEVDVVICATGFDSFSGSLTSMGLRNKDGVDIADVWKDGIESYLGIMINGFPNLFMIYSPQSPTAFSNGPTILECQADYIKDIIQALEQKKARTIEPTKEAERQWTDMIEELSKYTLLPLTESWWTGSNIPGKKKQMLTYPLGIDAYEKTCREKLEHWDGFDITYGDV